MILAEELLLLNYADVSSPIINSYNPPDKVAPMSTLEDEELVVSNSALLAFDPDGLPDSTAVTLTPVFDEPMFISMPPPTLFNPVVKPTDHIIDLLLPLYDDQDDAKIDPLTPVDQFLETINAKPLFQEVTLLVENKKSQLAQPKPIPSEPPNRVDATQ